MYKVGRFACINTNDDTRMKAAIAINTGSILRFLLWIMLFIFCIVVLTWFNDADLWQWRFLHAFAQIKTGMRRLVVRHILPYNTEPVLWVLHQGIKLMCGWNSSCKNAQLLVIAGTID